MGRLSRIQRQEFKQQKYVLSKEKFIPTMTNETRSIFLMILDKTQVSLLKFEPRKNTTHMLASGRYRFDRGFKNPKKYFFSHDLSPT